MIVLRRSSLGDVVLVGAVAAAAPGCTVVTDPRYAPLVARLRGVARVIPWGEPLPPGPVIDLQNDRRSRAYAADRRVDKRTATRLLRLATGLGRRPSVPAIYAEAAGVAPAPGPWIELPTRARDALVLIPGASARSKRWPGYAAMAAAWRGPIRVVGGPGEEALVAAVAAASPRAVAVVEAGFDGTLDAMASARLAIGGDTGLTHVAGACGVPVVTVFSSTDPADGFAVHAGAVVTRRDLACQPCTRHGRDVCPLGDLRCVDVPVADVLAAARAVDPGGAW